ncbi:hypothetical protein SCHPADRAFT_359021 [Schizopora paradoxa]|uniref:Uncharacterized protein n=1 Tax=Schizopora paradoxa TaxID=27342 RepID=A0A0H2RPL3_9AGAM|nr:hypothetical protein SCHPADRAFT_359021 [Schizopora paradoxa]
MCFCLFSMLLSTRKSIVKPLPSWTQFSKIGTLIHLVPHTHRQTRASIRRRIVAGANIH